MTKKAVVIGVNYYGQSGSLDGEGEDAEGIRASLYNHGFRSTNIYLLTEEDIDDDGPPTKENIINAMEWLVDDASSGDSLFFFFSGHGGRNSEICPKDYRRNGTISATKMRRTLVDPLPGGCRLTVAINACHSDDPFNLLYNYDSPMDFGLGTGENEDGRPTRGTVICLSACWKKQSAYGRVFSKAVESWLDSYPNGTYCQLWNHLWEQTARRQTSPTVSSSFEMDKNTKFRL